MLLTSEAPLPAASNQAAPATVLKVDDLTVTYADAEKSAVDHVSLSVAEGEVHGLVGESGSGKTSVASAVLGMLSAAASTSGSIAFGGIELFGMPDQRRREIMGGALCFVPQNPMASLNPVLTIGYQLVETIRAHNGISKQEAAARAIEALRKVGVPDPTRMLKRYPYEFSGGTLQRVLIAAAIVNSPRLIVADEPTSALDATVQRQIVDLLSSLVHHGSKMALLLISHEMGVVASLADRISVMYAGQIVEEGSSQQILDRPEHPYTRALLAAARGENASVKQQDRDPGLLTTCRFLPRCPVAIDECAGLPPQLFPVGEDHRARCYLPRQEGGR